MTWQLDSRQTSSAGQGIPQSSRLSYSTASLAETFRQFHNTQVGNEVGVDEFDISRSSLAWIYVY